MTDASISSEPSPQQNRSAGTGGSNLSNLSVESGRRLRQEFLADGPAPAIVGGLRTPFAESMTVFKNEDALSMSIHTVNALLEKLQLDPGDIDSLFYGTVMPDTRMPHIARSIVLDGGLPNGIETHLINEFCITSLVAANSLAKDIRLGDVKIGIAGGAEAMSNPCLAYTPAARDFFVDLSTARSKGDLLKKATGFSPTFIFPEKPAIKSPTTNLSMGQHCEITARELGISREIQDEITFRSHIRAAEAARNGTLNEEITPYKGLDHDTMINPEMTMEYLSSRYPAFDKRSGHGTITGRNASRLTDGASAVCIMSEDEAIDRGQDIKAYLIGSEFVEIAPEDGLLQAPAVALPRLLEKYNLTVDDIDVFEVHEAFGAQVAANLEMWEKGWDKYDVKGIGKIPEDKLNVNGGSLAIGHPLAATGGRLITTLANELHKRKQETGKPQIGVISACASEGKSCAMLLSTD
jgi:acetyl-CoA acetyltransferase family protein